MKSKINQILPAHCLTKHSDSKLYIVDYKNIKKGNAVISGFEPKGIKYVYLLNENCVEIFFDGFQENALELSRGLYNKQCECVIFPSICNEDDWVLFVETKYANNLKAAFDEDKDYPHSMTNQIIETVKYFRQKGILDVNKKVHAIVSFPNLIEDFNSTFFSGNISIEDILFKYKILIRATNSAKIISNKRIYLISN